MSGMQNTGMSQQHAWSAPFDIDPNGAMGPGSSPEDTWSNSSGEKIVPTALNVEDWFNFFGLTGELGALGENGAPI